jgi:hypothetical protein
VEDYLRSVGQAFTSLGDLDPCPHVGTTLTDFRLCHWLRCYSKEDPPPSRVKPLPLAVLHNVRQMAAFHGDVISHAVSDLSYMVFFWPLRPGEYCSSSESHPFRLCDVLLFIDYDRLTPLTCVLADLNYVTFITLTFTTQKNGVRGEIIGHARSSHLCVCPVVSVVNRVRYLRLHDASNDAPLCAIRSASSTAGCIISSNLVTGTIRILATILGPQLVYNADDVSARSCRAGGATALLCGRVDTSIFQLVGRWPSAVMLRYLHPS